MTTLREWLTRLWSTLRPTRSDEDLEQELRTHLELAMEDAKRRSGAGLEAERAARLRSGGVSQAMDVLRDQRGLPWLDNLVRDVQYAIRMLRRSPGFATVAILTLAVGIGSTTAIYSVVDAILLQPLPFPESDRLVRVVENVGSRTGGPPLPNGVNARDALDWGPRSRTLSDTVAISHTRGLMRTNAGMARLWGAQASDNTFSVFPTPALLGRTLDAGDEAHPDVVVLSFDTWRQLFQARPDVVGTTAEFQTTVPPVSRVVTVVGVLPETFAFPIERFDFYMPLAAADATAPRVSGVMIGRLRPGVSIEAATEEANVIGEEISPPPRGEALPRGVHRFEVQRVKEVIVEGWRSPSRLFLAAVVVVLAIVCANVANLLLARGTTRQREIALRLAIGAGRGRVVRQMLTECLVLAIAGGAVGALLAAACVKLITALTSVDAPGIFRFALGTSILPRANEIAINSKMFGVAFGLAVMASAIFGLLPAQRLSLANHTQVMANRGHGSRRGESRLRAALVVAQLVMAVVLLVGAGLLALSFVKLSTVERGYEPRGVVALQVVLPPDYSIARKTQTIDVLLDRLRAMPSTEAAGFTRSGLLIPEEIILGTFVPPGRSLDEMRSDPIKPLTRAVSPGYLTAIGARVLEGRELDAEDWSRPTPAIVITRTVARRFFGAGGAVGRLVAWHAGNAAAVEAQVVGVVEDVRNTSLDRDPKPEVFIDYRQLLALQQRWGESIERQDRIAIGFLSFAVRAVGDAAAALPRISQLVRSVDPNAGVDAIVPLERLVASSIARQRFYAVLLGVFAGVAGFLALIGVYGVLAYAVAQRTREIGVRMALGAQRAQVLALVLRQGLFLTTVGIAFGLLAAAAGARLVQGLLFGISPLDPVTFVAVSLMFGLVAMVASYVPARRATKVDPAMALRGD